MKKCPECDSEKIIKRARITDGGDTLMNMGFAVAATADTFAFMQNKRDICGGLTKISKKMYHKRQK